MYLVSLEDVFRVRDIVEILGVPFVVRLLNHDVALRKS